MARYGRKHGMYSTRTYKSWQSMKQRCDNPKDPSYPLYGGRGITYCYQWKSFETFYDEMGERPVGCSLDRIHNDGGYYKENCRWATSKQQTRNRRDTNKILFRGKKQCFLDWSRELGIARSTLYNRLKRGWSIEKAFSTPVGEK